MIVSLTGPILESFPARGGAGQTLQEQPAPKADILTGVIKEIEGGRILLEGEPMDSGEPSWRGWPWMRTPSSRSATPGLPPTTCRWAPGSRWS